MNAFNFVNSKFKFMYIFTTLRFNFTCYLLYFESEVLKLNLETNSANNTRLLSKLKTRIKSNTLI